MSGKGSAAGKGNKGGNKRKRCGTVDEVDRVSAFHGYKILLEFIDDDKGGKTKQTHGVVEDSQPSGISTVYSAIYEDGDVGLLDPEETKEQVDLYNEMNDQENEKYEKEIVEQEIELWEKNGPKGVLLNKFCCMAFENKGRYRGSTKLCVDMKGNEKLYTGFILGFRPRHWDMWDAREFEDADEIGVLYGRRAQELTKKGVDVLDIELQVGLYRVVCCDGTFGDFTPEEVRDAINRMNRIVDDESSGNELIVWCGSDKLVVQKKRAQM